MSVASADSPVDLDPLTRPNPGWSPYEEVQRPEPPATSTLACARSRGALGEQVFSVE